MVSGASKGIGRAIAEKLAAEGVRLSLCARGAEPLRAVARDLETKHGAACLAYPADLSRAEDIQGWVRATVEQLGGVDILVNNAGAAQGGAFLSSPTRRGSTAGSSSSSATSASRARSSRTSCGAGAAAWSTSSASPASSRSRTT